MLLKVIEFLGIFFVIYFLWFITGGVERGLERESAGRDNLLISLPEEG